jgi:hypothetical protein
MKKLICNFKLVISILLLSACSGKYYTVDDFIKIKKIDTHTHLDSKNTIIAEQAKADNFRLITINVDVAGSASLNEQFQVASFLHQKYPDIVDFTSSFTLEGWDSVNWADKTIAKLETDFANGAIGVKVWKNIGMTYKDSAGNFIMIDDPKFDKVIDFIILQNKTLVGHLGEPKNCWLPIDQMTVRGDMEYFTAHPEYHMFLHPESPSYEDQINARDHFLEKNPDLRFVGAHLGSLEWSIDELAKRLDKFPNMAVDMAERICHLQLQSQADREKVRRFFIKYQDRLIYATDFSFETTSDEILAETREELHKIWMEDWKYFVTADKMTNNKVEGEFEGLQLPKEVVDKIYYFNALHWFKIK